MIPIWPFDRRLLPALLFLSWLPAMASNSGIVDIEVDSAVRPTATVVVSTETAHVSKKADAMARSAEPVVQTKIMPSPTPLPDSIPVATPVVVKGVLKMKDLYRVGVRAYQDKDYEKAIRYFKTALSLHDSYTPKYYYAETHSLLGVIYQFFYPVPNHLELAKAEYLAAIQIDPQTKSAKKHLAEVNAKGSSQ